MINNKTHLESYFQESLVREMEKFRWSAPEELKNVTVDDLIDNWRDHLNRLNADILEGVPLTDNEFAQVMNKVNRISNSYEAAKILAMEGSVGKIDGIIRDNHPGLMRDRLTLTIFKRPEVSGGDSHYEIAREVRTSNGSRFDLVLLINGLPLINIELKKANVSTDQAFYQFKRYYEDGEFIFNFMAFSQMMVIMSESEMRYFATPKSLEDFNKSFVFHWADHNNKPVHQWEEVVAKFLRIPMAHQMVGDYLVIDEAIREENRRHMVLRPYQVHALQAIEAAAYGRDNEEGVPHGGFVWHTTGSGKTITSFKTALFLSTRSGFDKVVFLVDRRELDAKTSENFKAYSEYESVVVDDTDYTYQLGELLKSSSRGIVVTTTFKLNGLVKELEENQNDSLKDKKIVFIIDEAHRTTMGEMMGTIKNHFRKNGLFFGFTGTPLFDENQATGMITKKQELINTTEKLFGPELHRYTIDEAIADRNVLGFHIDYVNTGEFESHQVLREQLVNAIILEKPNESKRDVEREVFQYSDSEVEKEAEKREILIYQDETHIPRVVKEILDNWESQSQNKFFNAILTVAYKERVIAYYQEFKKQLKERDMNLNIALTFSFGDENSENKVDNEFIETMFADYESFTGIKFVVGDRTHGEENYFEDLVDRSTRGGSGRNPQNIDLVIVADQLLTGYDSKYLNTLYVDRNLKLQGLIQAYSRTNRLFGPAKEFGSIVNFKYPAITEEQVDRALKLYGSGGTSSNVIVDTYENAVRKLNVSVVNMKKVLLDPTRWQEIQNTDSESVFLNSFRAARAELNTVSQYYQFKWVDSDFGISQHSWSIYEGAYKNLMREDDFYDEPIIKPLVSDVKLSKTQIIDAQYILNIIGDKTKHEEGVKVIDNETLRLLDQKIQELSNLGEAQEAEQLREFVDRELMKGKVRSNTDLTLAFSEWLEKKKRAEIRDYSYVWGLEPELLEKSLNYYSIRDDYIPYSDEILTFDSYEKAKDKSAGNQLNHNIKLNKSLPKWMRKMKEKYK